MLLFTERKRKKKPKVDVDIDGDGREVAEKEPKRERKKTKSVEDEKLISEDEKEDVSGKGVERTERRSDETKSRKRRPDQGEEELKTEAESCSPEKKSRSGRYKKENVKKEKVAAEGLNLVENKPGNCGSQTTNLEKIYSESKDGGKKSKKNEATRMEEKGEEFGKDENYEGKSKRHRKKGKNDDESSLDGQEENKEEREGKNRSKVRWCTSFVSGNSRILGKDPSTLDSIRPIRFLVRKLFRSFHPSHNIAYFGRLFTMVIGLSGVQLSL